MFVLQSNALAVNKMNLIRHTLCPELSLMEYIYNYIYGRHFQFERQSKTKYSFLSCSYSVANIIEAKTIIICYDSKSSTSQKIVIIHLSIDLHLENVYSIISRPKSWSIIMLCIIIRTYMCVFVASRPYPSHDSSSKYVLMSWRRL